MTAAGLTQSRWIKGDLARSAAAATPTAQSLRPTFSGHTTSKTRSGRRPSILGAVRQKNIDPRWRAIRQETARGVVGGAGGGAAGGGGYGLAVAVVLLLVLGGGRGVLVLAQVLLPLLAQVMVMVVVVVVVAGVGRCHVGSHSRVLRMRLPSNSGT